MQRTNTAFQITMLNLEVVDTTPGTIVRIPSTIVTTFLLRKCLEVLQQERLLQEWQIVVLCSIFVGVEMQA